MNTNYLKRCQVVSAENHPNKSDIKKIKNDETVQISCTGTNEIFNDVKFSTFCKNNSRRCFLEKILQCSNLSKDTGNLLF